MGLEVRLMAEAEGTAGVTGVQTPPTPITVAVTDPDSQIAGTIRDLSKMIAGGLVSYGVAGSSNAALLAGIIAGILSMLWSRYNGLLTSRFIAAASALPVGASRGAIATKAAEVPPAAPVPALVLSDAQLAGLADQLRAHLAAQPAPPPPPVPVVAP
jgi:hypothetical protein